MAAPPLNTHAADAALMVLLMDEADAAAIMGRLSPAELDELGRHLCELDEVAPNQISNAILHFASVADSSGAIARGGPDRARSIITEALGPVKADSAMRRIMPDDRMQGTPALELARWLEPGVILRLIGGELPQTIAVLLVQLEPQVAAHVLAGLPEDMQPEMVHRVATLGPVAPAAISMLDTMLESRIGESFGAVPLHIGGAREAAELINQAGKAMEKRVMSVLGKRDKGVARAIENELFTFAHLYVLNPQMMGALLREIDSEVLTMALKGIPEEERDVFFAAMSSRAVDGLRDEIEGLGRIKMAEVQDAQKKIITVARRLADEGTLVLDSGDSDYV